MIKDSSISEYFPYFRERVMKLIKAQRKNKMMSGSEYYRNAPVKIFSENAGPLHEGRTPSLFGTQTLGSPTNGVDNNKVSKQEEKYVKPKYKDRKSVYNWLRPISFSVESVLIENTLIQGDNFAVMKIVFDFSEKSIFVNFYPEENKNVRKSYSVCLEVSFEEIAGMNVEMSTKEISLTCKSYKLVEISQENLKTVVSSNEISSQDLFGIEAPKEKMGLKIILSEHKDVMKLGQDHNLVNKLTFSKLSYSVNNQNNNGKIHPGLNIGEKILPPKKDKCKQIR